MKSSEGSYLLSEVKWAISPEAGIVHPYLYMKDKFIYYDLFTHKLLTYTWNAQEQFSRHYDNLLFECLDTEMIYCVEMKNNNDLSCGFSELPNYDVEEDRYIDFCGEVCKLCCDTYVDDEDLLSFASEIKKVRGIGKELVEFVSCDEDPIYIKYKKRREYKNIM